MSGASLTHAQPLYAPFQAGLTDWPTSIYIHVPFCQSRCIYCDFYVVLAKYGGQEAFVNALCQEMTQRFGPPRHTPITLKSLYVGGGTPSLLTPKHYQKILDHLSAWYGIDSQTEVTLEANPSSGPEAEYFARRADKNAETSFSHAHDRETAQSTEAHPEQLTAWLSEYRRVGFNRLSIGVQSLVDRELQALSRSHRSATVARFVQAAKQAGFANLSLDFMYGIPHQSLESWQQTLTALDALNVPHISLYGLHVASRTPLARLLPTGAYPLPDDETTVAMYHLALETLSCAGFQWYEFSNLARPGFASVHNPVYWRCENYWALGPSAHGYLSPTRYVVAADLSRYLEDPCGGDTFEHYSAQQQLENALIFGLRQAEGVHLPSLEKRFGVDVARRYGSAMQTYLDAGWLLFEQDRWRITPAGISMSNSILAEFIELEP
ncbi:MAG: coproporphyrinogen-III oxidase family protein [Candidatus Melainabacteria bacterium]|nr:coproporphyrinogen-III oxidase family protein [Candidatus Melainabacteria bacterium]